MIPRNKRWAVSVDYLHKLTEAELDFLDKFNREFHEGAIKKGDENALHNTDELRRSCYLQNTKQTRDLYGIKQAAGLMSYGDASFNGQLSLFETRASDIDEEARITEFLDAADYPAGSLVALAFETLDELRREHGQSQRNTGGRKG